MSQQSTMSIASFFLSAEPGMMVHQVLWPGSVTRWCLIHRSRRAKKSVFVSSRLTVLRLTSEHRVQAARFPCSTTTWQASETFFTALSMPCEWHCQVSGTRNGASLQACRSSDLRKAVSTGFVRLVVLQPMSSVSVSAWKLSAGGTNFLGRQCHCLLRPGSAG